MIRVLFVCHGNICRSTMAQFVFQDMVNKAGLSDRFHIDSAATSREEIGANVKHFFTLLGKMFFTSYGKEFFIYHGKQIFTSQGKHLFTRYGKQTLSSAQPCG